MSVCVCGDCNLSYNKLEFRSLMRVNEKATTEEKKKKTTNSWNRPSANITSTKCFGIVHTHSQKTRIHSITHTYMHRHINAHTIPYTFHASEMKRQMESKPKINQKKKN